jgi:hypothetical protein
MALLVLIQYFRLSLQLAGATVRIMVLLEVMAALVAVEVE